MLKKFLPGFTYILMFLTVLTTGCSRQTTPPVTPALEPVTVTVSAAASLTESFTEIGELFRGQYPQVDIVFNFAGSQELAQQILQGAPVDVFASANQKQMDLVMGGLRHTSETPVNFAQNKLVIIYPADNPGKLANLADLAKPGLKLVFAGSEVPVGQYSLDFLDKAEASGFFVPGYKQAVLANVVSYENNVRAVLTKIQLGEADAGIVYQTDANSAASDIELLTIPDELNVIADYPILALPDGPAGEWGQTFVDFILSDAGQAVLKKYGFSPVQ